MKNKKILVELLETFQLENSQKRIFKDIYNNKCKSIDKNINDQVDTIKAKKNQEIQIMQEKINKLKQELQDAIKTIKVNSMTSFINDIAKISEIELLIVEEKSKKNIREISKNESTYKNID